MTNPQGTQWESELRDAVRRMHIPADRYPKRGQKGEPDVWIGHESRPDSIIPVLSWKRLTKNKGAKRRSPDGERDVVVMRTTDFLRLVNLLHNDSRFRYEVQSKWTQNLNVTRVLGELVNWLEEHDENFTA